MMTALRYAYLHGFASSAASYKGTRLAERLRSFGVDLELPDLNAPSFGELTYSGALAAISRLDDDPSQRWCFIGSSMGGYLAARWAAQNPDRVHRLVLLCPGFDLTSRWPSIIGEAAFERWERTGSMRLADASGALVPVGWGFIEDARRHPPVPEVPCPTLILHGTQDEIVPIESSRRYVADHPSARLIELNDDHGLSSSVKRIGRATAEFFGLVC